MIVLPVESTPLANTNAGNNVLSALGTTIVDVVSVRIAPQNILNTFETVSTLVTWNVASVKEAAPAAPYVIALVVVL